MAVKNTKLGGVDFVREHPTFQDLNDTNNAIIKASIVGQTQIPFSILKSAGAFTNEGNLCADRTTVAAGIKGTINTGESTGAYLSNKYILNLTDVAPSHTIHNPDSFSNPANAFDSDNDTFAETTDSSTFTRYFGTTFTTGTYNLFYLSATLHNSSGSSTSRSHNVQLETFNGTSWTTFATIFTNSSSSGVSLTSNIGVWVDISSATNIQGLRARFNVQGTTNSAYARVRQFKYGNYSGNNTVISDTGTLTLTGDEKFIAVYNSATIPTGTSMKCQLSDETKTISADTTLTANGTTLIPITTAPTVDDVLKLTFTLETTDTAVTPSWNGFGCFRYKGD